MNGRKIRYTHMVRKLLGVLLLAFCGGITLFAQNVLDHSTNIIQHKQFDWKFISTQNFDIYYYTPDPGMANQVAKQAESSLYDVSRLFDYKNTSRYAIYLYVSPFDMIQSNQFPQDRFKEGGITPVRNNTTALVYPGNSLKFAQRVQSAVSSLLIEDFYFGGTVQASIQNSVLLHTPRWYSEGLPAFIGESWTHEDERWLTSLENENILDYALEGNEHINHVARKSFWYFIVQQYGPEKLTEIFYLTRLTRSVDAGIIHAIGIPLKSLTERWWEFVLQRINENKEYRESFPDLTQEVPIDNKGRLLGYAMNPKHPEAAVYLEKNGIHRIEIYDFETESWKSTNIKSGFKTDQADIFDIHMPMSWSKDGERLMAVFFDKKEEVMTLYERSTGAHTMIPFRPGLDAITGIDWSFDGKWIAVSGLRQGAIDIYVTTPGNGRFRQVTNDLYDDLSPVWSQDDQRIYYASTRPVDTLSDEPVRFDHYIRATDVFSITPEGEELTQVTHTEQFNERPVMAISSFELYLVTDQAGIVNLMKKNVFRGDSTFQTNLTQGINDVFVTDSLFTFSTPEKGRMGLFYGNPSEIVGEVIVLDSRLRFSENIAWRKQQRLIKMQAEIDSIRKANENKPVEDQGSMNNPEPKPDSVDKPKVSYYVFDEEGDEIEEKTARRKLLKSKKRDQKIKKYERPDFDTTDVGQAKIAKTRWSASRVTSAFRFDPVFKLNMLLEAELTDHTGNQKITAGFRPFIDLKSSDFYLQYANLKGRVDWYAGITRSARYLNREGFLARYNSIRADGNVVYPMNRYLSVGAGVHGVQIRRLGLDPFLPDGQVDGSDVLTGGSAFLRYDTRDQVLNFTRSGDYAFIRLNNALSIGGDSTSFVALGFDFRHYQPVFKKMVLAGKFHGGFSLGTNPKRYFLGGVDEWLFGRFGNSPDFPMYDAVSDLHYMEYATPVRGFLFNGRNGTKFAAASLELRVPISRMGANSLNSNPLYNVEFIPFFDVGTAWDEGNPLSQRNPIDTEVIDSYPLNIKIQTLKSPFIMGFGGGLRMMVFGYSLRADLAWGVEDYTILDPKLHITLGKNF